MASTFISLPISGAALPQPLGPGDSPTFYNLTLTALSMAGVVHTDASGNLSTSLIVNADIDSGAAISFSKMETLTADRGLVSNSSGVIGVFPEDVSSATVAATDLLLVSDSDDSNKVKKVTAQSVADLASSPVWSVVTNNLSSSSTTIVSQTATASFLRGEFIMTFDSASLGVRSLKFSVNNNDGALSDTIYAKLGASIDIEISAQINAGNVEIVCINNELHDVSLKMAQLII